MSKVALIILGIGICSSHLVAVDMLTVEEGEIVDVLAVSRESGYCLFHQAILKGDEGSVARIIDNNDTVLRVVVNGDTALCLAVETGGLAIIKLLVDYGADINQYNGKGETPLGIAIRIHAAHIVEYFLSLPFIDCRKLTAFEKHFYAPLKLAERLLLVPYSACAECAELRVNYTDPESYHNVGKCLVHALLRQKLGLQ